MDFRNYTDVPLGIKNNNVGNIKNFNSNFYTGQVGNDAKGHAIFKDMVFGVEAFSNDVLYKLFGRSPLLNTIEKLVNVYAPSSDGNDTNSYINYLVQKTNIGRNETIQKNKTDLLNLLNAIAAMEVGAKYLKMIPSSDLTNGYNKTFKKYAIGAGGAGATATNPPQQTLFILAGFLLIYLAVKK